MGLCRKYKSYYKQKYIFCKLQTQVKGHAILSKNNSASYVK